MPRQAATRPCSPSGSAPSSVTHLRPRGWRDHGFASTLDYLAECCRLVAAETGLLAHANAGALFADELAQLREVAVSQGMMLESLARVPRVPPGVAGQDTRTTPLATLEAAGRLQIAFTTGILVGIGETRADRLVALRAIAASHARHGHVQEVIVQNFLPKAGDRHARRGALPRRGAPLVDRGRPRACCPPTSTSRRPRT